MKGKPFQHEHEKGSIDTMAIYAIPCNAIARADAKYFQARKKNSLAIRTASSGGPEDLSVRAWLSSPESALKTVCVSARQIDESKWQLALAEAQLASFHIKPEFELEVDFDGEQLILQGRDLTLKGKQGIPWFLQVRHAIPFCPLGQRSLVPVVQCKPV